MSLNFRHSSSCTSKQISCLNAATLDAFIIHEMVGFSVPILNKIVIAQEDKATDALVLLLNCFCDIH